MRVVVLASVTGQSWEVAYSRIVQAAVVSQVLVHERRGDAWAAECYTLVRVTLDERVAQDDYGHARRADVLLGAEEDDGVGA